MNKSISELKMGELIKIRKTIFQDESIYKKSFAEISISFLRFFISINSFSTFSQIYQQYVISSKRQDAPKVEQDFYRWICTTYLSLRCQPKDKLLDIYNEAANDLKELNGHLLDINSEKKKIDQINNQRGYLNTEEAYFIKQLEYYKQKNINAKDEIINFITYEIRSYALQRSKERSANKSYIEKMPYRYSRSKVYPDIFSYYNFRCLSEVSNKFLDLDIVAYRKVRELYKTNREEFKIYLKKYILRPNAENSDLIERINNLIKENSILNKRSLIFKTIFTRFKEKDYLSVVIMLPLQIEGIFHDVCLKIGINESELRFASINKKLDSLEEKSKNFIHYEYYSFKFPIIRNKIAHGEHIDDDLEYLAMMLILDLLPVCELAFSEDIKFNRKINLIKKINQEKCFHSLIELIELLDIDIPEFYQMTDSYKSACNQYLTEEFWNYVCDQVKKQRITQRTIKFNDLDIIRKIRKLVRKEFAKNKCNNFFENLPRLIEEIQMKENIRKQNIFRMTSTVESD